jgi:hypothetical protein
MRDHRLNRLALLTQGVALVGLGISQLGCGKDAAPPNELPHINAPPQPVSTDAAPPVAPPTPSASAASSAGNAAFAIPPSPIRVNAPPKKPPPAPTNP